MSAKTAKAWGHIYRDGRLCRTAQAKRDVVWDVPVYIVTVAEYMRLKRAARKPTCAGCVDQREGSGDCLRCSRAFKDYYRAAKKGGGR